MREYDIIAIGGGKRVLHTMNRAGEHGAKAAVIEEKKLGGTCVNIGCVPKKIMGMELKSQRASTNMDLTMVSQVLVMNLIMQHFGKKS